MMHRSLSLAAFALAAAVAPLAAQSGPAADEVIDRAVAAWAKVKTTRGSFEQTVSNSLTGSSATARGEFQQERPHRLAIRFTDPDGDRIVSDGRVVWLYLPSSTPGQAIRRSAADGAGVPFDVTGQFLDDPRAKYEVTDGGVATVDGRATRELVLVPRPGREAPFTKATVWVDSADGLIRQFQLAEPSGITRRVRLTALTVNAPVDRGAFSFVPPKGVRIVER